MGTESFILGLFYPVHSGMTPLTLSPNQSPYNSWQEVTHHFPGNAHSLPPLWAMSSGQNAWV